MWWFSELQRDEKKNILSWIGEIKLSRGYYSCGTCSERRIPLDEQLEVKDRNWSSSLLQAMIWLSGKERSYSEAEESLARIGHLYVSDSTIWRQVEKWAACFAQAEVKPEETATDPNQKMGVSLDGAMVNIRQEGWKELKVGTVFALETQLHWDKESKEWVEQAHAVDNSYVGYLGNATEFGTLMWQEAERRDWDTHYDTQIVGDGAEWIWNQADMHFYDSIQTVDWYHASEHLHQAAQSLYPDNDTLRVRWLNKAETKLFQGQIEPLIQELQDTGQAGYFQNHKRRMNYLELREEGYLIGSGTVESAAKQFKARFSGPGMRWNREGLQRLIPIRASIMAHDFDQRWNIAYQNFPLN